MRTRVLLLSFLMLAALWLPRTARAEGGILDSPSIALPAGVQFDALKVLADKRHRFIRGSHINWSTALSYAGEAKDLNTFITALLDIPGTTVTVRFSKEAGVAIVPAFNKANEAIGDEPCQWRVNHTAGRKTYRHFDILVYLGDGKIDIEELRLPVLNGLEPSEETNRVTGSETILKRQSGAEATLEVVRPKSGAEATLELVRPKSGAEATLEVVRPKLSQITPGADNDAAGQPKELDQDQKPDSTISQRIAGKWQIDAELTTRLTGEQVPNEIRQGIVEFKNDLSAVDRLLPKSRDELKKKGIYAAGTAQVSGRPVNVKDGPQVFVVTSYAGEPYLGIFDPSDGKYPKVPSWARVTVAEGREREHDLLFLTHPGALRGGPFSQAFRRVAADQHADRAGDKRSADGDVPKRNARRVTEAYLTALVAGRTKEAETLAIPNQKPATKQRADALRHLRGKEIGLSSVHASDQHGRAIALSEPIQLKEPNIDGRREGRLYIKLNKEGAEWRVREIDLMDGDTAQGVVEHFIQRYPDAMPVPEAKKAPAKDRGGSREEKPQRVEPENGAALQQEPIRAQPPQAAWGESLSGLRAGLSFRIAGGRERTSRIGDTMTLVVTIHNVGSDTVEYTYPSNIFSFDGLAPVVEDEQGNQLKVLMPPIDWRVHLLPDLGHEDLYKQFQLNQPWDSAAL